MGNVYALLAGVGVYQNPRIVSLPACLKDVEMMRNALCIGLEVPFENIKTCGQDGQVYLSQFARSMKEFASMMEKDDTFILYFSGHGKEGHLIFTDQFLSVQSLIQFIAKTSCKNVVLILDCCNAGKFETDAVPAFDVNQTVSEFAGHGYAVMASCSEDEVSGFHPRLKMSLFTSYIVAALINCPKTKDGNKMLHDINSLVVNYSRFYEKQNSGRKQFPIFRSSLGGTIFFPVKAEKPYIQKHVSFKGDGFIVEDVLPINSLRDKRLAPMVLVPEDVSVEKLAEITRIIRNQILYEDIFADPASEARHKGKKTSMVYCYFGHDDSDMINHRYFARTLWVDDTMDKNHWYRPQKDAVMSGDIYVMPDRGYQMVHNIQEVKVTAEEYVSLLQPIQAEIITLAEQFIMLFHKYQNNEITDQELSQLYQGWHKRITQLYIQITDLPMEPDELHGMIDEIYSLAGAVQDFSLLYTQRNMQESTVENREWLLNRAVKRYYESLEKLKNLQQ